MLQNFNQFVIVLEYKINFSYVANVLCENRDKPEMHCNGKCHLRKQLEKDQQQEHNSTSGKEKFEVVYIDNLLSFNLQSLAPFTQLTAFYQDAALPSPTFSFFRPPQV
ncbi:hypothetical protein SAMN05518672_101587 [Chitinophaga sp. CF118]|nr:hypothetical protein SAMN05518672_101587 [Chitinophaga sp. CF118]